MNNHYDPTSVSEAAETWECLKIYPVPASSFITIEAERMQAINIYNVKGQLVMSVSADGNPNIHIDVDEFASGLYLVKGFDLHGSTREGRFVKE